MRIIVYAILFILGYRILKKFFAPDLGSSRQHRDIHYNTPPPPADKSNIIEDVEYEEID